ncbi:type I-E CRISPR-associated protein Cse1/CasA [Micromonospora sp. HM5-17]|uniref:type I-E CRISPR-associated protein Cse1/CasA n=1 Tax=Micromonospora sp. HM5-17 TaxID=2487710 RepID=UPI00131587C7|nr:type I-E CRISPR-associated protein Cse1/CasA [Micromonospora sp. HM5-17]
MMSDDDFHEESVDVVLLQPFRTGLVPIGGGPVIDPAAPDPPSPDVLAALLDASVNLGAPHGVPADLVRTIARSPVPASFQRSPWLLNHRVLVFADGVCRVGAHLLRYQPHLGVYTDEPETHPPVAPARATVPRPRPSAERIGASFDLVTEPWVPVVRGNGAIVDVGLRQLFMEAHDIRRITGETPTMSAALYRLVLAMFHRSYGPDSDSVWAELWSARELPPDPLDRYLERYGDRFDLFHPTVPFLQCPGLAELTPSTPGKLVPHRAVGNNVTLFDHTTSSDAVRLTPAEAARWLVTTLAFDPGGMKTPFVKDKSSERAPCNDFGVVVVEGGDLKQTLLLNAVVYRPDAEQPRMTGQQDAPAWEREPPSPHPGKRTARGWTDLLTWPSRRILLRADDIDGATMVTGVTLTPGDRLDVALPDEELMAAYRRPADRAGRARRDAPMLPVKLHPVRGVWRHSVELLITDPWQEDRHRQRPRALDHVANLAERGHISSETVYTLRVFGQQLDSKASVVEAWLEESVPAPVALLRARDDRLGGLIGAAIDYADEVGSALRSLQADFRRDMRAEPGGRIELSYWPRLSRPFATFLKGLNEDRVAGRSEAATARTWQAAVSRIARSVADAWLAGSAAEARAMLTLGRHQRNFQMRLGKASDAFLRQIITYTDREESDDV